MFVVVVQATARKSIIGPFPSAAKASGWAQNNVRPGDTFVVRRMISPDDL